MKALILFLLISVLSSPVFSQDTDDTIYVNAGKEFQIILQSESEETADCEWQLARPLNDDLVEYVSKEPMVDRKEKWTFRAAGSGKTIIYFQYVNTLAENSLPLDTYSYEIDIR